MKNTSTLAAIPLFALFSGAVIAQDRQLIEVIDQNTGKQFSMVAVDGARNLVSLGDGEFNYAIEALDGKIKVYSVSFNGAAAARKGEHIADSELQLIADAEGSATAIPGMTIAARPVTAADQQQIKQRLQEDRARLAALPGATTVSH